MREINKRMSIGIGDVGKKWKKKTINFVNLFYTSVGYAALGQCRLYTVELLSI